MYQHFSKDDKSRLLSLNFNKFLLTQIHIKFKFQHENYEFINNYYMKIFKHFLLLTLIKNSQIHIKSLITNIIIVRNLIKIFK